VDFMIGLPPESGWERFKGRLSRIHPVIWAAIITSIFSLVGVIVVALNRSASLDRRETHNAVIQTHGVSSQATTGNNSPVVVNNYFFGTQPNTENLANIGRPPEEPAKTDSPGLDARLVVKEVVSNTVHFAFRIYNRSSTPFDNLRFIYSSSGGSGMDSKQPKPYRLEPGESMVFERYGVGSTVTVPNEPRLIPITLSVDYTTVSGGSTNCHFYHFGFALFSVSTEVGEYPSVGYKRGSQSFTPQEMTDLMGTSEVLASPIGGNMFWYQFTNAPPNSLLIFFATPDRSLVYNAADENITFRSRLADGKDMILVHDVKGQTWHHIAVQWNPKDAGLMVDAKGKWTEPK